MFHINNTIAKIMIYLRRKKKNRIITFSNYNFLLAYREKEQKNIIYYQLLILVYITCYKIFKLIDYFIL